MYDREDARMKLKTKHFGEIEFSEDKLINFPEGMVGFENNKKFLFIENDDKEIPFHWLQSVEEPDLAFVVVNPMAIRPDYEFSISDDVEKKLKLSGKGFDIIAVLAVVVVPEDVNMMTMNLLAPIVINAEIRMGEQVVLLDDRYHTKHLISEELERACELVGHKA